MNIINDNTEYLITKYEQCSDWIKKNEVALTVLAASLALKGLSHLLFSSPTTSLIGASSNAIAGSALLFSGIKEYKKPIKERNRNTHTKTAAIVKMLVGSGLLCWSGYDLWSYFNPPTISSLLSELNEERIIAIGDVHGDLDGLKENLRQAGLVNNHGDWIGGKQVFVQLGDIVDRGPKSEETWLYLRKLQEQARGAGGKVIRIVGNHELMWLNRDFRYINPTTDTYFTRERMIGAISDDILKCSAQHGCDAQAAYVAGNGKIVFIHAGLVNDMNEVLKKEIAEIGAVAVENVTNPSIFERINKILKDAVKYGTYEHPLFNAGQARGGTGVDGVFWADKSALDKQAVSSVVQIVGHNPPFNGASPIRLDPNQRVIYADAGMLDRYGGNRCFVEIEKNAIYSHCKTGLNWIKQIL